MTRRTRDKGKPVVWVAESGGIDHHQLHEVFADRESALGWLRMQRGKSVESAAQTDAYERRTYTERAATEDDEERRAYYLARAEKSEYDRFPSEIEDGFDGGASYSEGEYGLRYTITPHVPRTFKEVSDA